MNCPVCNVTLQISERQGIEIDYCPQCRGVWLDRGELDKMIERSVSAMPGYAHAQQLPHDSGRRHDKHRGDHRDSHYRKRSFHHDLFD
jgi:Zn-finger nucleic acid-binding protein